MRAAFLVRLGSNCRYTEPAQVKYIEPLVNLLSPGITGLGLHASSPCVCVHLTGQWKCPPS